MKELVLALMAKGYGFSYFANEDKPEILIQMENGHLIRIQEYDDNLCKVASYAGKKKLAGTYVKFKKVINWL